MTFPCVVLTELSDVLPFSKCKIVQLGDVQMHVSSVALFLSFCTCIIRAIRTAERYLSLKRGTETARRMLEERILKRIYLLKEIKEQAQKGF